MLPIIAEGIGSIVMGLINRFLPNTEQEKKDALQAALQAQLAQIEVDKAQVEVNEEEAKSENIFVSGWRPFIGWVCGCAFAWQYLLCPLTTYLLVTFGHPVPPMPTFNLDVMMPVLMGMLGLGAMRTYEKISK